MEGTDTRLESERPEVADALRSMNWEERLEQARARREAALKVKAASGKAPVVRIIDAAAVARLRDGGAAPKRAPEARVVPLREAPPPDTPLPSPPLSTPAPVPAATEPVAAQPRSEIVAKTATGFGIGLGIGTSLVAAAVVLGLVSLRAPAPETAPPVAVAEADLPAPEPQAAAAPAPAPAPAPAAPADTAPVLPDFEIAALGAPPALGSLPVAPLLGTPTGFGEVPAAPAEPASGPPAGLARGLGVAPLPGPLAEAGDDVLPLLSNITPVALVLPRAAGPAAPAPDAAPAAASALPRPVLPPLLEAWLAAGDLAEPVAVAYPRASADPAARRAALPPGPAVPDVTFAALPTLVPAPPAPPLRPPPRAEPAVPGAGGLSVRVGVPETVPDEEMERIASLLGETGVEELRVDRVGYKINDTQVRFYRPEDAQAADALGRLFGAEVRDFTDFRPSPPGGTLEVFLAGDRIAPPPEPPRRAAAPVRARPQPPDELTIMRDRIVNRLRRGEHL